jgi:hypothetical protein
MSDYNLAVTWSGKDGLSDSDAGKVISGADFNSEFTTVQTAVNSKANIASPTLTGTPAAPTAAAGTDTTQIATTAFVKAAAEDLSAPTGYAAELRASAAAFTKAVVAICVVSVPAAAVGAAGVPVKVGEAIFAFELTAV